jgi:hypothetical protein
VGRLGEDLIGSTPKLNDETTWYQESTRVEDATLQVIAGTSDREWEHPDEHKNWIRMSHGLVMDEVNIRAGVSHQYAVIVKDNGVEQTERPWWASDWSEGGDYYVDYADGKVVFQWVPTGPVTASFSYATTSLWTLKPAAGFQLEIEDAEVQFSENAVMHDCIIHEAKGWAIAFAPQLVPPLDPYDLVSLSTARYDRFPQIVDEARGAYPKIPAGIGGTARGIPSALYGFKFIYKAVRTLKSAAGMQLDVYLENSKACDGDHITGTFYCAKSVDPDWTG